MKPLTYNQLMKKLYSSNSEQLRCVCKFTDVDDTKLRLLPETLTIQELAQIEPYFREPSNKTDDLTKDVKRQGLSVKPYQPTTNDK